MSYNEVKVKNMRHMKNKIIKNERGTVLLWTMMFMALFFLTVSSVAVTTILEIRQSTKIDSSTAAYLLAEAGAERAKNYADSGNVTIPISGRIGGSTNTYQFQVTKALAGQTTAYDDPIRYCVNTSVSSTKYCYYSQGTVGNSIRRKIDGSRSDIPLSQGKTIDLYSTAGFSPTYGITGLLNMTPSGTSPTTFTYNVTIEKITSASGNTSNTGIVDTGGDTNKKVIRIFRETNKIWLGLGYINSTGGGGYTGYSASSNISQTISTSINDIRATLVYRKGASDLKQNTVTLKLVDVSTEQCLGVLTLNNITEMETLGNISPYYAFFDGSNLTINNTTGKIRADRNVLSSDYYYYKNLFLRVE